jgi:hypothetical protein
MPVEDWYGAAAVGFAFGMTVAVNAIRARFSPLGRLVHAAEQARRTPITAVPDGATVKVAGWVALADEVLVAPFSERRCCRYTAELRRSVVVDHAPYVETIGRDEGGRAFVIEDEAGKALVEVCPATLTVAMQRKVGRVREDWDQWEWVLADGDAIAVFGKARWEHDRDPGAMPCVGYRDLPRVLVVDAAVILEAW